MTAIRPITTSEENLRESRRWDGFIMQLLVPTATARFGPGGHIRRARPDEDAKLATDFVIEPSGTRVAARVRGNRKTGERYDRDGWELEFTITCRDERGFPCEYQKLVEGRAANWFFYGHDRDLADGQTLSPWFLIDLDRPGVRDYLREWRGRELGPDRKAEGQRRWFYAYNVLGLARRCGKDVFLDFDSPRLRRWKA